MERTTISKSYNLKWVVKFAPHYKFTDNGVLINCHRGKEIKRSLIGYTQGYYIEGKFYSLARLRNYLVKIKQNKIPF